MEIGADIRGGGKPRAGGWPVFVKVSPATKLPEGVCRYTTCTKGTLSEEPFPKELVKLKSERMSAACCSTSPFCCGTLVIGACAVRNRSRLLPAGWWCCALCVKQAHDLNALVYALACGGPEMYLGGPTQPPTTDCMSMLASTLKGRSEMQTCPGACPGMW